MEKRGTQTSTKEREKDKMKTLPVILIGLMACLAIGITTARGQVGYSVEDLGVVKGMETSEVVALNNQGNVAGTGYGGSHSCAFKYDYLTKFMEDAGGFNSRGFGISSTNMVVGDAFFGPAMLSRSHAAMFSGGIAKELGVMKGQVYSRANAANGAGQVVGFSGATRDGSDSRAFVWTYYTGMKDLGTLGGAYAQANAINEAGFITGTAQTAAMFVVTHAFIYQKSATGGTMRDLGVLGGHSSYGMAINAYNHVVGYSTREANSERFHAFLHNTKNMIDLGSLGLKGTDSDVSVALGINKSDHVVGYTYLAGAPGMPLHQVAFLWRKAGGMVDLNTLLYGPGRNYRLTSAAAINDDGQIVANAYDKLNGGLHAVLLTPIPPPGH